MEMAWRPLKPKPRLRIDRTMIDRRGIIECQMWIYALVTQVTGIAFALGRNGWDLAAMIFAAAFFWDASGKVRGNG